MPHQGSKDKRKRRKLKDTSAAVKASSGLGGIEQAIERFKNVFKSKKKKKGQR